MEKSLIHWLDSRIKDLQKIKYDGGSPEFMSAKGKEKGYKEVKEYVATHTITVDVLAEFAKFIHDQCTDQYGHLQMSEEADGEFITDSYRGAAEDFLIEYSKKIEKSK
ncbi:MAG: hypothetical protein WC979_00280 [Candidatus Pacearchaeota archaeon]|jgi:hypothetical protein|nr:hypothetical protein [Clostridia bacterium]